MPKTISFIVALVLALATITPALAHQSSYNGPIVLESAHPDLAQGLLTLRGNFGLRSLTVWMGDDRLDIVKHKSDEITVLLPNQIVPGTYEVIVARSRLTNQYDSMSVAVVQYGSGGGNGTPGPRGPAGPQGPVGSQGPAGPQGAAGAQGPAGLAGPAGAAGSPGAPGAPGPAGPQGTAGVSGYVTTLSNVTPLSVANFGVVTLTSDCPAGTSISSAFIYIDVSGRPRPIPLPMTGFPSGPGQWTFVVQNPNNFVFTTDIRHGAVCAAAN